MWRRRALFGTAAVWGIVSLARLTRLVDPPVPPGPELDTGLLAFFKRVIPADAGCLLVLPGEFGSDTGSAPRLRYELYPRRYDDIRASAGEAASREVMRRGGLRFVVVPDASRYAPESWLRQARDWLRRIELDSNRYVLEVVG